MLLQCVSDANRQVAKFSGASAFKLEASATTLLPLAMIGATTDTIPSKAGASGASATTTPVGSGIVKLKCDVATGFTDPKICENLSVQPA